ncbi:MAG: thioredoxin fold domain-containing protein [Pseudomonadota bacterium]
MNKKYLILAAMFLISASSLVSGEMLKCTAKDWTQTSREAEPSNAPILIVFTADDCAYCEMLKQDVLNPMFEHDKHNKLAVVREVDINAGGKMTDFNGERIRSRQFKERYKIFATPTLLMLDRDGKLLAGPIVGYSSKDEYRSLLESHLEDYRITQIH